MDKITTDRMNYQESFIRGEETCNAAGTEKALL